MSPLPRERKIGRGEEKNQFRGDLVGLVAEPDLAFRIFANIGSTFHQCGGYSFVNHLIILI